MPVWGWAGAGEKVSVRFAGQEKSAVADVQGRWEVRLEALTASSHPAALVIAADTTLTLTDVLVGEVWLCSGPSNMEKPLGEQRGQKSVFNAEAEIQAADFPQSGCSKSSLPAVPFRTDNPFSAVPAQ